MGTKRFCRVIFLTGLIGLTSSFACAQNTVEETYAAPIRAYIENNVSLWITEPIVIDAINEQNKWSAGLQKSQILSLDKTWRLETKQDDHPMINKALASDLSKFLAKQQVDSNGMLLEIFVMDAKGLNVGQSRVTYDYWQGDEAKWLNTYPKGPDALFIDDINIDDSTLSFQSQASMSITDPKTGKVIGAITLGFNFEKL